MAQRTCIVEECSAPQVARGWCRTHYNRWHYAGSVELPAKRSQCRHCDSDLDGRRSDTVYCSPKCRSDAYESRRREARNSARRARNKARLASAVKTCKDCGAEFSPETNIRRQFCSDSCARRWQRSHESGSCAEVDCDRTVRAKGLCNMHYKRVLRAQGRMNDKNWTPARKVAWQARRALTRGAPDAEKFDYTDIFERDGWVCGICTLPVDRDLKWPHPMSASLDHITPVSLGGCHSPENVQCSHLTCNVRKGNRVGAA